MKSTIVAVLILFLSTCVFAHSGGTDRCGGHNDRKRGGYHVHNLSKYCACYPDAKQCKPKEPKPDTKTEKSDKKPSVTGEVKQ